MSAEWGEIKSYQKDDRNAILVSCTIDPVLKRARAAVVMSAVCMCASFSVRSERTHECIFFSDSKIIFYKNTCKYIFQ